jgi:hypothetical protein
MRRVIRKNRKQNMNSEQLQQFGGILRFIINELDVPEEVYVEAVRKYQRLAEWFKRDNENKYRTDSEIYPQGSIRLGTMIRAIREGDEYDVDLVYRRDLVKESITQADLKEQAGEQLRRYVEQLRRQAKTCLNWKRTGAAGRWCIRNAFTWTFSLPFQMTTRWVSISATQSTPFLLPIRSFGTGNTATRRKTSQISGKSGLKKRSIF